MANEEQLGILKQGTRHWNRWRRRNPEIKLDLCNIDLPGADLHGYDLRGADFSGSDLNGADLRQSLLVGADLSYARLEKAKLSRANVSKANLQDAGLEYAQLRNTDLSFAKLLGARLSNANLSGAFLLGANLVGADLRNVNLKEACLTRANLSNACLNNATLIAADLSYVTLVEAELEGANLTNCNVYGISAWDLKLEGAIQSNLVITNEDADRMFVDYRPRSNVIQLDSLELAQFVYLLLNNQKIRHVIDTITSKVVLILGRFTPDRKSVLDAIRDELRRRDYLPILFDFEKPDSKDLTGTISTLANMARFVIADLTDPSSVPHELAVIAPSTIVPIQTILLKGNREYAMFVDLKTRYHWVLEPYEYESTELLIADLNERLIAPAEAKAKDLKRK